jgi:hypothetical protein
VQAFEILQNLLADLTGAEIAKMYEKAGEESLLEAIQQTFLDESSDLHRAVSLTPPLSAGNADLPSTTYIQSL